MLLINPKYSRNAVQNLLVRLVGVFLAIALSWAGVDSAYAQINQTGNTSSSSSFTPVTKECKPGRCFASAQDRKDYANSNSCYFLEDVCDAEGSKGKEQGLLAKAESFVEGLMDGLGDQVEQLWDMLSSPLETIQAGYQLVKALVDDWEGTVKALASLAGEGINNLMIQATQCGSYDLGKIIGENVNPFVVLKVGVRLVRFGGKIEDAVRATKLEVGCASFVAGTPVWLAKDLGLQASVVPIEGITIGQSVFSRDDKAWKDGPQRVENTFGRVALGYWELQTEQELYRLTEEHPVWVQGKGWTETKNVREDDVLATASGDALVRANTVVNQSTRVYNFSVANTPNYFVGERGLWVHNAACSLNPNLPAGKYVRDVVDGIKQNNGAAPSGTYRPNYPNGAPFDNDGRGGGQILPSKNADGSPITYTEYDVHPYDPSKNRGKERVVKGSDERYWYTDNHYQTFTEVK